MSESISAFLSDYASASAIGSLANSPLPRTVARLNDCVLQLCILLLQPRQLRQSCLQLHGRCSAMAYHQSGGGARPPPPRSHAASACTQETCGGQTIWEVGGKEPVAEHLSLYRLGSCARGRLLPCAPAPAALTNPPSALPSHQAAPAASWRCCCFPLPATAPRAAATPDTSDMQPSEALCARKCKAPSAMPALIGKMLHTRRRPLQSDGRTHYCLLHPPSQGGRVRKHGKVWEEANATMEVAHEVGKGMKACMRASGRMYQRRDSLP